MGPLYASLGIGAEYGVEPQADRILRAKAQLPFYRGNVGFAF